MPPRHNYWTILFGGKPTAFRAATQEELLPTFKQIQAKHADAVMMWFARGRLWRSEEDARATFERSRFDRPGPRPESQGRSFKPSGDWRDKPRYDRPPGPPKPRDGETGRPAWQNRGTTPPAFARKPSGPGYGEAPPPPASPKSRSDEGGKPHGGGLGKPGGTGGGWRDKPRDDRPRGPRPEWKDKPRFDRPPGPQKPEWQNRGPKPPWRDKPPGDRPRGPKPEWRDRPRDDRPRDPNAPRPEWRDKQRSRRPEWKDKPRFDRPPGPPPASPKPRGGEGGKWRSGEGGPEKPRDDRPRNPNSPRPEGKGKPAYGPPKSVTPPADGRRGRDWRPGGAHKDPRDRFKVPRDVKRAQFKRNLKRDRSGPPRKKKDEE